MLVDAERLTWDPCDPSMLDRIRDFISHGIGASHSFDVRCRRVLQGVAAARGYRLGDDGRRRVLLANGSRQAVVEYENALTSLERLHRLYKSYRARGHGPAVLISGDQAIPEPTAEAISWARHRAPLHVVALNEVASLFNVLLA